MLARGWLAYPVTPMHARLPPKSGCIRQHMVGLHSLVAERRHSSVTRYAKRSVACRDSPRHQPLRAGGSPLPRYPSDCPTHRIAPSAQYIAIGEKTAEERFNTLARGWLAYPVTSMHALLPPKSGCRRPSRAKKRPMVGIPTIGLCIATFCCAITC